MLGPAKALLVSCALAAAACRGDGGASDAAAPDGGVTPDLAVVYKYVGSAGARDDRFAAGGHSFSAFAAFLTDQVFCASQALGGCQVSVCPRSAATPTPASAGPIAVTGGARAVTIAPGTNGAYAPINDSTRLLFGGGETLTFNAPGAAVPAFSLAVVAPDAVTFTSATPSAVDRARDLTFTWNAVANGEVEVNLSNVDAGGSTQTSGTCSFPASAGTATISSAVLGQLSPGTQGGINIWSKAEQSMVDGDWLIGARLDDYAGTKNGQRYAVDTAFQ